MLLVFPLLLLSSAGPGSVGPGFEIVLFIALRSLNDAKLWPVFTAR